ncbi:hypothetical protein BDFB_014159 [Asbolus verrucosus]|uniref:Uncharacterized protein n=1 Tax=Asbolus verrucosus TaxID=1661398 RepID=A0A482VGQ9_ASBVE|nr:hypothetical protein BDFB_014159 [Asbolus verrucosus]
MSDVRTFTKCSRCSTVPEILFAGHLKRSEAVSGKRGKEKSPFNSRLRFSALCRLHAGGGKINVIVALMPPGHLRLPLWQCGCIDTQDMATHRKSPWNTAGCYWICTDPGIGDCFPRRPI